MRARNHMLPVTDYKGRWAEGRDMTCPCRPCWNPHHISDYLGMMCLTREQGSCPYPAAMETVAPPLHLKHSTRATVCVRCRQRIGDESCAIVP